MCGLVGFIYKGSNGFCTTDRSLVEDMLHMDALRGEDSVGVGAFYNDGEMELLKKADISVFSFLKEKEYSGMKTALVSKGKAFIGHNRKATKGSINDESAHPWVIDNRFLFMHNGTLYSHKHLADTDVDSEALGIHLTKCEGDKNKLEDALGHVHGAYACVWIDQVKEKLYLLKNKERPLHLALCNFGVIIGSEPGFMLAAAARNNTKINNFEEVDNETLYEFDLNASDEKATTPIKTKLEIKKSKASHKSTPLAVTGTDNTKGNSGTAASGAKTFFRGAATKAAFKKFKRQFVGRRVDFYCDDYTSHTTDVPHPEEVGDWVLFGEIFGVEPKHVVYARVVDKLETEVFELTDRILSGVVYSVTYSPTKEQFSIYIDNIVKQVYGKEETSTTVH